MTSLNPDALCPLVMADVMAEFYDGPHATPSPSDHGPIYIGIKNLAEDGRLDLSDIRHISEADFPTWTKRVEPRAGDLVFTYEASLHRYAILPDGFRGCLGRRIALLRPDPDVADTDFLLYYFLSPEWRRTVEQRINIGSTVDRIPLVDFPAFPVRLPDIPAQKRISSVLRNYDDLIENNRRRIQILEEMAQRIYREWFVEFRYPGHEDVPLAESDLGSVPENWELMPASVAIEVNPKVPIDKKAEHAFVPMGSLSESTCHIESVEVRKGSSGAKFSLGDTLFARITPCLENGKTGFVQFLAMGETGTGSTELIVLRSRHVTPEFVYLLARSEPFRANAIQSMSGASGRQRVRQECFDSYAVAVPPRGLLDQFSEVVAPMFALSHSLFEMLRNLRSTRDFLLPRLVSGEVDVSDRDIDTSELVA